MQESSLKGSEQSLFLDFTYSSGNEGDLSSERLLRTTKSSRKRGKTTSIVKKHLTPQTSKTELLSRTSSRLYAGESKQKSSNVANSPNEATCSLKAPGIYTPRNTDVSHIHLQLYARPETINEDYFYCKQPPLKKPKTTRATQTLYRESSAQTLPYLPEVKNEPKALEYIEVFKLPQILPGDGPPGIYEVEVLERARKRWAFAEALKENFKNGMVKARDQLNRMQYKKILESFAFEQWIEREEYIMECQMMRLDIVIRMFNKREQQMHENSKKAIELAYQQILQKRDAALKKNDIQYKRAIRRLESDKLKRPRNWRGYNQESLAQQLSDPQSLYYAPQTRFGVSPNQRHFEGDVKEVFDIETTDIEKMEIDGKNIECPFAKLKEWSKPKDSSKEIETNFLSDENLQKLYETLKSLRLQFVKHKSQPKCLVKKSVSEKSVEKIPIEEIPKLHVLSEDDESVKSVETEIRFDRKHSNEEMNKIRPIQKNPRRYSTFALQRKEEKRFRRILFVDRRREEIEEMISSIEGKRIGWILRFLGEEMIRLEELRKLHFITILAQRERWRREAAEAGLRQKENDMRQVFEEIFQTVNELNTTACEDFFKEIIPPDTRAYADDLATGYVTKLAKQIDEDLNRWLKSFEAIQNPNNFDKLRILLRDMVFPNIEQIMYRKEETQVVHYIINDVLFPNVYKELETYDISFAISSDLVDRLIDNDLYFFSSECDSECDCRNVCICPVEEREAKAIIRKLIRRGVPGRRWKTSTERIAYENFMDVLDDAFDQIDIEKEIEQESADEIGCLSILHKKNSLYDFTSPKFLKDENRTSLSLIERFPDWVKEINYQETISLNKLRRCSSEMNIHNPSIHYNKIHYNSNASIYKAEVLMKSSYQTDWLKQMKEHKSKEKQLVANILRDILNSIGFDEDISELDAEEGEYEHPAEIEHSVIYHNIDQEYNQESSTIVEGSVEDLLPSAKSSSSESSYEEISQSELDRMTEDKCKCREEILKEAYILQQIAIGKIRVKRRTEEVDPQSTEPVSFEYLSENKEEIKEEVEEEYEEGKSDGESDENDLQDSDSGQAIIIESKSENYNIQNDDKDSQSTSDDMDVRMIENELDNNEVVAGQATLEPETVADEPVIEETTVAVEELPANAENAEPATVEAPEVTE